MEHALITLHVGLCATAIYAGGVLFVDMIMDRFIELQVVWFLRCSLGSNIAALLFGFPKISSSVKIAVVAVYASAVIVLAWKKFNLRGPWREVFTFALAFVLHLNVLDFCMQMFGPTALIIRFGRPLFEALQLILLALCIGLGVLATGRLPRHLASRPGRVSEAEVRKTS